MRRQQPAPFERRTHPARSGVSRRQLLTALGCAPVAAWGAGFREASASVLAERSGAKEAGQVDIGGRSLYADVRGSGAPAVVFDAGHGADARSWLLVQPELATEVLTVSYDRAGIARSDPAPGDGPRTSGMDVDDLRALLAALEIPPPYVLVGHSYGGMNVRLFAARFPREVAGLVLVDAVHEDYFAGLRALDPVQADALDELLEAIKPRVDFEASRAEMRAAGPLPPVPAVVIARGEMDFPPPEPTAETEALWQKMQRDLASQVPGAELLMAEGSGHDVPFARPEVVIEAVRRVTGGWRSASGLRRPVSAPQSFRPSTPRYAG